MKIKHKVQRKLDPTFQAELNLCSLCGLTPWWQGVVCAGSEDWPWQWCQVHIWLLCQRRVGCQPFWPPAGSAVLLPETWRWWAGCGWRRCVPWLWGWAFHPPVCRPSTEGHPSPRVSAASLGTLLSLCPHPSSFWFCFFISDCCAQDCESEKPPRSRFRCKHMWDYLQAWSCVEVYPTQRSRDLVPEEGFSLVLRAGLGDLQKGWSNSSSSVYILIWALQGHWALFSF